ncbi:MAG: phytanoyl-CoA dioxygenase [Trueperaceae bacterium]|nr:phytanoyl-CoA dioxygenase [Trueperaceae bacterium]
MHDAQIMKSVMETYGATHKGITEQHRHELDVLGYTVFEDVIDPIWLENLRTTFETLFKQEGSNAGSEAPTPGSDQVRRLADLVNKGKVFDLIYTHPIVLSAAYHVIKKPFKLVSLNGHDPKPGFGQQALHSDFQGSRLAGASQQTNALWMLDDIAEDNGATRVVPGSHLSPHFPQDLMENVMNKHPDEVYITGSAGSVAFFNGQIWHGGTTNLSNRTRRVYHSAFTARENQQQTDQRAYLRPETRARLTNEARFLLDV